MELKREREREREKAVLTEKSGTVRRGSERGVNKTSRSKQTRTHEHSDTHKHEHEHEHSERVLREK